MESVVKGDNVNDELYNELIKSILALSEWIKKFPILIMLIILYLKILLRLNIFILKNDGVQIPTKSDKGFKDTFFFLDITPYKKRMIDLEQF